MAKKITGEQRELRKKLSVFLEDVGINDVDGVKNLFKELVGTILENGLEGELEEELGYSKYDYRNKNTDNSRNGHTEKTVTGSFGDMKISVPRDRNGEFEPKLIKKHQTSLTGDIEEKIISMSVKFMALTSVTARSAA